MNTRQRWWIAGGLALALASAAAGWADMVKLKDGTLLEGEITGESAAFVTIVVEFGGGTIRQTREVPRAEVVEVKRLTAEEKRQAQMQKDYQALAKHRLDPQRSFPLAQYEEALQKVFRPFLAQYPNSPYASQVTALVQEWQAERDRVAGGEAKQGGQWLSAAEAATLANQERGSQWLQAARALVDQGKPEQAIPLLQNAAALPTQPALATEARDLLATVCQQLVGAVDGQLAQLQQATATTRNVAAQARQAIVVYEQESQQKKARKQSDKSYQSMGDRDATFMATQTKMAELRTKLNAAESQLFHLEGQLTVVQQKSVQLHQLANQAGVQVAAAPKPPVATAATAATATPAAEVAAAPAVEEPPAAPQTQEPLDALASTVQWCKDRWVWLVGGAVVLLWLLSRAMN